MADTYYYGEEDDIEFTPSGGSAIDLTGPSTVVTVDEATETKALATRSNPQRKAVRKNGGTIKVEGFEDLDAAMWNNANLQRTTAGTLKIYRQGNASGHTTYSYPATVTSRTYDSTVNEGVKWTLNLEITGDRTDNTVP